MMLSRRLYPALLWMGLASSANAAQAADYGAALLVDEHTTPALARLSALLDAGGVKSVTLHAPGAAEFNAAIARLTAGARNLPVALLYYRGGYHYAAGKLQLQGGDAASLLRQLWEGGARMSTLILDACPDAALTPQDAAVLQHALETALPPGAALVLSHDPTVACSSDDAYAEALAQQLQRPAQPAAELLQAVQQQLTPVTAATQLYISMLGDASLIATRGPAALPSAADAATVQGYSDAAAQNDAIALIKLRRLGRGGSVLAQRALGNLYMSGLGVPQDYVEAQRWYAAGAAAGDANSEYLLGLMYENGYAGPKDLERAKSLYSQAAAQGVKEANSALVRLKH